MNEPRCDYNRMVECPRCGRDCKVCGWHPDISLKRRRELRRKYPAALLDLEIRCEQEGGKK